MTAKVVLSQAALLDAKAKYEGGAALSEIAGLLGISKKAMGRIFNEAEITIRASRETLVMRERIESHQATTFWEPQAVQMMIAA